MSAAEALQRAAAVGVDLTRKGGKLVIASRGPLPTDLAEDLRRHRDEIIRLLGEPWDEVGFPAFIAHLARTRTDASAVTIQGTGRSCCHCGEGAGQILRVAIPEGIFPLHRGCVSSWFASLPPYSRLEDEG